MAHSERPATSDAPFRILVVEDDPKIARLILTHLTKAGMECFHAGNGEAALASLREKEPHLVLLDLNMPGVDGFTACMHIRQESNVPIIVVTAHGEIPNELQSLKIGADDFVAKPFEPALLVARVITQLRRVYRYDVAGAEEEEAAPSSLPPGWASCQSCCYMGPIKVFQRTDSQGRATTACPHCKSPASVAFTVS